MTEREKVAGAIAAAMADYNAEWPSERSLSTEEGTVLLGPGGRLDSLGLVSLIVGIEEQIDERIGIRLALADEMVASPDIPFSTVGSLVEFVCGLVARHAADERS